jgi:recombinational DNA repair protein (RecF pathway)
MDEKCCICNKKLPQSGIYTIKGRKYCAKCAREVIENERKTSE